MSRLHLENLERRELFHAAALLEAPASADLAAPPSECLGAPPAVVREASQVRVAAGDVNGDGVFEVDAFTVDNQPQPGTLGFSWGVSMLPYIEQDNVYKSLSRDFVDGTSNTMLFAAADSTGQLDVWEHAYAMPAGPEANGIIAVLIGLTVDPSDPSGETLSGADHLLSEEPIYYPGLIQSAIDAVMAEWPAV